MYRTRCQARQVLGPIRHFTTSLRLAESPSSGGPFSAIYEVSRRVRGPLGSAGLSPRSLKRHLDRFVVGQDRAKKVLSVAMYNHYLRTQETQRREQSRNRQRRQAADQAAHSFGEGQIGQPTPQRAPDPLTVGYPKPASDPLPGQSHTHTEQAPEQADAASHPVIEKSNVLLLGPTGVGKTLLAKTLANALDVPFSISDCTPFTQAGYIGDDADVCVSRLLTAANYDVAKAEHGIIVLDEVDKLAARRVTGGRDVSGEGVQQALLKIIEGTTIQIQAKSEKGSRPPSAATSGRHDSFSHSPTLGPSGLTPGFGGLPSSSKGDTYNVRTDNILFIFTGAFIGLHKMILDRVSKGSIGFGASIRSNTPKEGEHETLLARANEEDIELFKRHVPFYIPSEPTQASYSSSNSVERVPPNSSSIHYPFPEANLHSPDAELNLLDLVTPPDLQEYGLIPELIGRIPIQASLTPLSRVALLRVLTEPQNSLISQFDALFKLSGIHLRFTRAALEEIADAAFALGTGARGLRSIVEGVLSDAMFEAPGSETEYVIITQEVAKRKAPAIFLPGRMSAKADEIIGREERRWERAWLEKYGHDRAAEAGIEAVSTSFEEYRNREAIGGFA